MVGTGTARPAQSARIGIRVDAGVTTGVGHVVRCLALAEELASRGAEVVFLGEVGVSWLLDELTARCLPPRPGPWESAELVKTAREHRLDAMVLDSYSLDPTCAAALRRAGVTTLAIVDGDLRGQVPDLFLDQNLDSELSPVALPEGSRRLAGLRYALVRDAVFEALL